MPTTELAFGPAVNKSVHVLTHEQMARMVALTEGARRVPWELGIVPYLRGLGPEPVRLLKDASVDGVALPAIIDSGERHIGPFED